MCTYAPQGCGNELFFVGSDYGKKIKGKKRHILVDTLGLLLHAVVHPADIQDRDGGVLVLHVVRFVSVFAKALC
jgi:hypothetical protein